MPKVLFYLVSSRGTKRYEILSIAARTLNNKTAMDDFLLAWAEKSHCWDSSENSISYGYQTPTKTKRFILTSKGVDRIDRRTKLLSRFLSRTEATKQMKSKIKLEKWFEERGIRMFPKEYKLAEYVS
jgi:hypothetical protein